MPFQTPEIIQTHAPRRTVHEGHVDGPMMSVQGKPTHTAGPGRAGIRLPPVTHDRGFPLVCETRVRRVIPVHGLAAVPGAIAENRDSAAVAADVGLPVQFGRVEPAVVARLESAGYVGHKYDVMEQQRLLGKRDKRHQ